MESVSREQYLIDLDDELLLGGVIISEWCILIVRHTDIAFISGADLATIVLALSAIETYLRSEYPAGRKAGAYDLIEKAPIAADLKKDIHVLRRYRNRWVHVEEPEFDQDLLDNPDRYAQEIEEMARTSVRVLRRTIYENQCV